jgi:acyl-CoA reductase-like NAD-dependent aldehyde dehydrogenase
VVKPAEQTPLAVARLMELIQEAGIPPGVVNLVNGRGHITGDAMVRHPGVDLVSFTGGTATGKTIMSTAGAGLKPCSLELGGKSANIIFASANFERALDGALLGIFSNNGQQCLAGSRILVERKVGDPMDPMTEIGPLAFRAHLERVLSYVGIAEAEGATLLTGGARAPGFTRGHYMQPTAVLAPSNQTRVCQEEVFGPFATFVIFDGFDEAIAMANESRFGLVSYVWSDDVGIALKATRAIRSGVVWVNTPMVRELRAPFGGVKESGLGREGGHSSMQFYTAEKTTTIPVEAVGMARMGMG